MPDPGGDLRDDVARQPQNRENTLFFSLLAGKPDDETGSQLTASSAKRPFIAARNRP